MPIDVVNANQVESNKWVVDVFKSSVAHVLFVLFYKKLVSKGPAVVRMLQRMAIGVVNANQVESNKWVVDVFKSSVAHVLFVFFYKKLV